MKTLYIACNGSEVLAARPPTTNEFDSVGITGCDTVILSTWGDGRYTVGVEIVSHNPFGLPAVRYEQWSSWDSFEGAMKCFMTE